MAEKLDLLLEAERRGILPPEQKTLLDEARRRGLVPGGGARPAAPAAPAIPEVTASGPLRSPLDDPLLGQAFREGGARAVAGAQPPAAPAPVPGDLAFGRAAARRLLDNILATPELLADATLLRPLEMLARGISGATGGAIDATAAAGSAREQVRGVLDLPSATDLAAGIETAVQAAPGMAQQFGEFLQRPLVGPTADPGQRLPQPSLGERFRQAQEQEMVTDIQMAQGAPLATGAGELAGDIATLAGGRAALRGGTFAQQAAPVLAQRAQTIWGRAIQTTGRTLARAGGRAGEAGAEGAFLAMLQDSDPAMVGGIAAGSQVAAQPLIGLVKRFANNRLGQTVLTASVISLGIQGLTPGGLNRFLPTFEGLSQEALIAILVGGAGVVVGGRVPREFTTNQAVVELANVIPRGALLSVLTSYAKDPARVGPVLAKFSEDPDFFGPKAKRLLERALTTENIELSGTIDRLMEDRDFRQRFNALTEASANQ